MSETADTTHVHLDEALPGVPEDVATTTDDSTEPSAGHCILVRTAIAPWITEFMGTFLVTQSGARVYTGHF